MRLRWVVTAAMCALMPLWASAQTVHKETVIWDFLNGIRIHGQPFVPGAVSPLPLLPMARIVRQAAFRWELMLRETLRTVPSLPFLLPLLLMVRIVQQAAFRKGLTPLAMRKAVRPWLLRIHG